MAEEIDVGRLVASIVLDTQSLQEGTENALEELNKLADSRVKIKTEIDKQTLNYVISAMESIGIKAEDVTGYLNAAFGKNSAGLGNVRMYAAQLEEIATKIDICRNKIQSLNNQGDVDDTSLQKYKDALSALEKQYDNTTANLDKYVQGVINLVDEYCNAEQEIEKMSGISQPIINSTGEQAARSYADTIVYVREVLEKLEVTGTEADRIITNCFSDISGLQKYQNQIDIVSRKIENQKQVLEQLENVKYRAEQISNTSLYNDTVTQIEREKIKLMELEVKYNDVVSHQDAYVSRVVANYKRQADAAETAAQRQMTAADRTVQKQNNEDVASSVSLLTSSLRTYNTIVPGTINNVTNLVRQINALRKAMQSGASKALVWSNAIVMGIGIVATVVSNIINNIQEAKDKAEQAKEEAMQNATEFTQSYKENAESLKELSQEYTSLKTQLDTYNLSREDEIELKNQLYALQEELISQYGAEADSINLVTGSIEEQKKATENLQESEAEKYIDKNYNGYIDAKEKLAEQQTFELGIVYTTENSSKKYDSAQQVVKDAFEELGAYKSDSQFAEEGGWKQTFSIDLSIGDAEKKIDELSEKMRQFHLNGTINDEQYAEIEKKISSAYEKIAEADIADSKDIVETYEEIQNRLNGIVSEDNKLEETIQNINQTMTQSISAVQEYNRSMQDLEKAYQTIAKGGGVDVDTLNSLIEKYPELAQYVAETGDLTLNNGQKIAEMYQQNKDALIKQLNVEKAALEQQKENLGIDTSSLVMKDAIAERIEEINAQLKVYSQETLDISTQQEKVWETVSNELDGLASAYQTLADGKQLDIDTTLELIDKYPSLASAMAKTGELGKAQSDIFKTLFEAKKNDYIITQQSALDNIRATEAETKLIIASLQTQIAMYGFKFEYLNEIAGKTAEVARLEAEAEKYEAKIKVLQNLNIDDYGGSSSGSDRNEALQEELNLLDHKKAIGQLTTQQELNWLNRINQTYSMNTDEKMDMEKRLYNVKKQLQEEAEQAAEDALNAEYERIENLKSLGKLNTQQELAQLEQIRKKYKLNAEQAMELEIKLYNLKKELKQEETDSLDTLADAVTEALKNKYEEQQKAEEKLIDESIENWQKWEDETTAAIQSEIDALDKLSETQESENARQEYEQKRQATELQLAYEKDDYNRKQLEKELNRLDKEEAQRLLEEEIKARKEELQAQMETVQETSSAAQEKLQAEKEALAENYEELTREFALRAEAEKVILNSTQQETVALIKSYAPEYNMAGQTLGEALYEGMKGKIDNIISYVAQLESCVDSYQTKLAATANAATDDFWASRNAYERELAAMSVESSAAAKNVTVQQTVNFNQPVESPVETRRQLDRTSQALAQQIASGV